MRHENAACGAEPLWLTYALYGCCTLLSQVLIVINVKLISKLGTAYTLVKPVGDNTSQPASDDFKPAATPAAALDVAPAAAAASADAPAGASGQPEAHNSVVEPARSLRSKPAGFLSAGVGSADTV